MEIIDALTHDYYWIWVIIVLLFLYMPFWYRNKQRAK